jgi:hypothetical protein
MSGRSGASVRAFFFLCKAVHDVKDVKTIAHLLYGEGFLPADGTQPNVSVVPQQDIDAFVEMRRQDMAVFGSEAICDYPFPVVVRGWEPFRCFFNCHFHKRGVRASLGGGVISQWIEGVDPLEYAEPFARELVRIAKRLYETMQPAYGYIDDPLAAEYPGSHLQRAIERQLITLNWVNFFGPEYVERYGRDFLKGIPGWKTEDLPDGGIFYQSRPNFVVKDENAHREWQQLVIDYFSAVGIEISFDFPPL